MLKRKKLWYGFLVLIMAVSSVYAIYAEISRKDWLWVAIGCMGLIGIIATYGVIAARTEKKG